MRHGSYATWLWCTGLTLGLLIATGCSKQPEAAGERAAGAAPKAAADTDIVLNKMPAGKEYSGFLKDYSKLKPSIVLGGDALTFVNADEKKNLHKYIAIIVEPVQVYLASDADQSKMPAKAHGVAARYFHRALGEAVSDAFPITDQPGPLVLRLRSALIGVDVGAETAAAAKTPESLERAIDIGKVGVEMELVDSETGEQIAAMVDHEKLGAGAAIGSTRFTREEKWAAATGAFQEWAMRVRNFLDASHELDGDNAKRADQSYKPYSDAPAAR